MSPRVIPRLARTSVLLVALAAACDRSTTAAPTTRESYSEYAVASQSALTPRNGPSFSVIPIPGDVIVNGSFEQNGGVNTSGTFGGWGTFSTAPAFIGGWAVQSGTVLLGTSTVPAPTDGHFAAFSWNVAPSVQFLFQDVTVPASGGTLSFDVAIQNRDGAYFSPALFTPPPNPNQQFRADLVDPAQAPNSPATLMALYQSHPGDPLTGPYHHVSVDVAALAGHHVRLRFAIAHDLGNMEVGIDNVTLVTRDVTPPVITYTGGLASYTVDQNINITCTATDDLSGIASTTCATINAPAYSFSIGDTTITSAATDNAGNIGHGSVSFAVTLSCPSMTPLVVRFVTDAKWQKKLVDRMSNVCDKVGKDVPSKDEQVGEFLKEVGRALDAGAISSGNAAVLTRLVQLL